MAPALYYHCDLSVCLSVHLSACLSVCVCLSVLVNFVLILDCIYLLPAQWEMWTLWMSKTQMALSVPCWLFYRRDGGMGHVRSKDWDWSGSVIIVRNNIDSGWIIIHISTTTGANLTKILHNNLHRVALDVAILWLCTGVAWAVDVSHVVN